MPLVFVTSRTNKLEEAKRYIDVPLISQDIELTEIQTLDLSEIVKHKAEQAFQIIKSPLIVDDIGLSLDAYGGFPGPFIKFLLKSGGNSLLLKMLQHEPNRNAKVTCTIGYHDGREVHIFSGMTDGVIAIEDIGTNGWGFDSVFIPEGAKITYAQMTDEEKEKVSFRVRALSLFNTYIDSHPPVV